jgi:hypothetical protein
MGQYDVRLIPSTSFKFADLLSKSIHNGVRRLSISPIASESSSSIDCESMSLPLSRTSELIVGTEFSSTSDDIEAVRTQTHVWPAVDHRIDPMFNKIMVITALTGDILTVFACLSSAYLYMVTVSLNNCD